MLQAQKINTINHQSLSVLIHQDGLSFYTYSKNRRHGTWNINFKTALHPEQIKEEIAKAHNDDPLMLPFNKITLFYHHNLFSIIPLPLFNENEAVDYLKYNARLLKTDVISHDTLVESDTVLAYIALENINNFYFEKYGSFQYFHYATGLLKRSYKTNQDLKSVQIDIDLFKSDFYLTVMQSQQLIAHNLFQHDKVEDILYYVMFCIQQNDLNPEKLHVTLHAPQSDKAMKLIELLKIYIAHVQQETDYLNYQEELVCV